MLTWKLWTALEKERYSTLYHRILREPQTFHRSTLQEMWKNMQTQLGAALLVAIVLFFATSGRWALLNTIVQLLPLPLLISGTAAGLVCAVSISRSMADEQRRGRFDLVSITPFGAAGASWAICHRSYQDSKLLYHVKRAPLVVYGMMAVVTAFFFIMMVMLWFFLVTSNSEDYQPAEFATIWIAIATSYSILAALFADLIQSLAVGCITGVLASRYTQDALDARSLSLALYLIIQFTFYALMAFFSFILVPTLYDIFGLTPGIESLVLRVLVFLFTRELLIMYLWRALAQQLNTTQDELSRAAGLAP